eukprot:755961-Hanusia_phi.AAC.9
MEITLDSHKVDLFWNAVYFDALGVLTALIPPTPSKNGNSRESSVLFIDVHSGNASVKAKLNGTVADGVFAQDTKAGLYFFLLTSQGKRYVVCWSIQDENPSTLLQSDTLFDIVSMHFNPYTGHLHGIFSNDNQYYTRFIEFDWKNDGVVSDFDIQPYISPVDIGIFSAQRSFFDKQTMAFDKWRSVAYFFDAESSKLLKIDLSSKLYQIFLQSGVTGFLQLYSNIPVIQNVQPINLQTMTYNNVTLFGENFGVSKPELAASTCGVLTVNSHLNSELSLSWTSDTSLVMQVQPQSVPGNVIADLSIDSYPLTVQYSFSPLFHSFSPQVGGRFLSQNVTISGSGFCGDAPYRCKWNFSDSVFFTSSWYIDDTSIQCPTPTIGNLRGTCKDLRCETVGILSLIYNSYSVYAQVNDEAHRFRVSPGLPSTLREFFYSSLPALTVEMQVTPIVAIQDEYGNNCEGDFVMICNVSYLLCNTTCRHTTQQYTGTLYSTAVFQFPGLTVPYNEFDLVFYVEDQPQVPPLVVGLVATFVNGPATVMVRQQPKDIISLSNFDPPVSVEVRDKWYRMLSNVTVNVSLHLADQSSSYSTLSALLNQPVQGSLIGEIVTQAVNGVAVFANLTVLHAGYGLILKFQSGDSETFSAPFNVLARKPQRLMCLSPCLASYRYASMESLPKLRIVVLDSLNNVVNVSIFVHTYLVQTSSEPVRGSLIGMTVEQTSSGLADFQGLAVDKLALTYSLQFSATELLTYETHSFSITPGEAKSLQASRLPSSAISLRLLDPQPEIIAFDAGNNSVSWCGLVTVSVMCDCVISNAVGGTVSVEPYEQVARFTDLTIRAAAPHTRLVFQSVGLAEYVSDPFVVNYSLPSNLSVVNLSTGVIAGQPQDVDVVVFVQDEGGNRVFEPCSSIVLRVAGFPFEEVAVGLSQAQCAQGEGRFPALGFKKTGSYIIRFLSGSLQSQEYVIHVASSVPARLANTSSFPQGAQSGSQLSPAPSFCVQDSEGNTVTQSHLSVVAATGGVSKTFSVEQGCAQLLPFSLTSAGLVLVTVSAGSLPPLHFTVLVSPGPPARLNVTVTPAEAVSGRPLSPAPQVEVLDEFDNRVLDHVGNVSVTTDPVVLSEGTRVRGFEQGLASFPDLKVLDAIADLRLSFQHSSLNLSATSDPFTVTSSGLCCLFVNSSSSPVVAGEKFQVVIRLEDTFGNLVPAPVPVNISLLGGHLEGTLLVAAAGGYAAFSDLIITRKGSPYRLVFEALGFEDVKLLGEPFLVLPNVMYTTEFSDSAIDGNISSIDFSINAGLYLNNLTMSLVDKFRNKLDGEERNVSLSLINSTREEKLLDCQGLSSCLVSLNMSRPQGSILLRARLDLEIACTDFDNERERLTVRVGYSNDQVAAERSLVDLGPWRGCTANCSRYQPVLTDLDIIDVFDAERTTIQLVASEHVNFAPCNNIFVIARIRIIMIYGFELSSSSLVGSRVAIQSEGSALAHSKINLPGLYAIASRSPDLRDTITCCVSVSLGVPYQLAVFTQPQTSVSTLSFSVQPVVSILDVGGNLIRANNISVEVELADAISTESKFPNLHGTTAISSVDGFVHFTDLKIDVAGRFVLIFSHVRRVLTSVLSDSFEIKIGAARRLQVKVQPSLVNSAGESFPTQPKVRVVDDGGNDVERREGDVTVEIVLNGGIVGKLSGNPRASFDNETYEAGFTDLSIDKAGESYILLFSSPGLESVECLPLIVRAGAGHSMRILKDAQDVVVDQVFQVILEVLDLGLNRVLAQTNVSISLLRQSGLNCSGCLQGTTTAQSVQGIVTFPDLSINEEVTSARLMLTASDLPPVSSQSFSVWLPEQVIDGDLSVIVSSLVTSSSDLGAELRASLSSLLLVQTSQIVVEELVEVLQQGTRTSWTAKFLVLSSVVSPQVSLKGLEGILRGKGLDAVVLDLRFQASSNVSVDTDVWSGYWMSQDQNLQANLKYLQSSNSLDLYTSFANEDVVCSGTVRESTCAWALNPTSDVCPEQVEASQASLLCFDSNSVPLAGMALSMSPAGGLLGISTDSSRPTVETSCR